MALNGGKLSASGPHPTFSTLYCDKNPQHPLNRRPARPQSQSGHFGEQKNLLHLPAIEPWIVQPTVKSLYLLCFPTPYISYTVSREILVIPVLLTVSGQSKLQQQSATCHKDNITWLCTQKLICCKLLP